MPGVWVHLRFPVAPRGYGPAGVPIFLSRITDNTDDHRIFRFDAASSGGGEWCGWAGKKRK